MRNATRVPALAAAFTVVCCCFCAADEAEVVRQRCQERLQAADAEINKNNAEIQRLVKDKMVALGEFRLGQFCSECRRSKSEIEAKGEDFFQHVRKVEGRVVAASVAELQAKEREFNDKIARTEDARDAALQRRQQTLTECQAQQSRIAAEEGRRREEALRQRIRNEQERQARIAEEERRRQEMADAEEARGQRDRDTEAVRRDQARQQRQADRDRWWIESYAEQARTQREFEERMERRQIEREEARDRQQQAIEMLKAQAANRPAQPLADLSAFSIQDLPASAPDLEQLGRSVFEETSVPNADTGPLATARAVGAETIRSMADELFNQVKTGEDVDVRQAARNSISAWLGNMQDAVVAGLDDATRRALLSLPESPSFDAAVWYDTFVSPKTTMITPMHAARNVVAFFEETVGSRLRAFFASEEE